jgi:hypothetical protein
MGRVFWSVWKVPIFFGSYCLHLRCNAFLVYDVISRKTGIIIFPVESSSTLIHAFSSVTDPWYFVCLYNCQFLRRKYSVNEWLVSSFSQKRGQPSCCCASDSLLGNTGPDSRCMLETDVYQSAEIGQVCWAVKQFTYIHKVFCLDVDLRQGFLASPFVVFGAFAKKRFKLSS